MRLANEMARAGHVPRGVRLLGYPCVCGMSTGKRGSEVDAVKQDAPEAGVHDHVALDEIELYGEVLSAVAGVDRSLTVEEIDVVLGVGR